MVGSWEAAENTPQSSSTSCSRSLGCLSLTAESCLSGGSFCVTSGLPCVWLSRPPRSEIALGKASGRIALRSLWCLWNVSAEGTWVGPLCCLCVLENRDYVFLTSVSLMPAIRQGLRDLLRCRTQLGSRVSHSQSTPAMWPSAACNRLLPQ